MLGRSLLIFVNYGDVMCVLILLYSELMPPLPMGGVFAVEEIISSKRPTATAVSFYVTYKHDVEYMSCFFFFFFVQIQWEWQDNDHEWRPYDKTENRVIEVQYCMYV